MIQVWFLGIDPSFYGPPRLIAPSETAVARRVGLFCNKGPTPLTTAIAVTRAGSAPFVLEMRMESPGFNS